ncbi:MAG: cohesin domain-containing protein [Coriobacteriia bacterium]|nr:cohesin domain-containing protein [Coriobacteriia bacterium]
MIKKVGISVIAVLFILSTIQFPRLVFAEGSAMITLSNNEATAPGEEFTVNVEITNNPGFCGAAFEFRYDTNTLELVRFISEGLMKGGTLENPAESVIGFISGTDINDDGLLFSAVFKVKDNALTGMYNIEMDVRQGRALNFVNSDRDVVEVIFIPGFVIVTGNNEPQANNDDQPNPDQSNNDEPGQLTDPNDNQPTNNNPIRDTSRIVAVSPNGSEREFLMRNNGSDREYSFDDGISWTRVPDDGIITTPEGTKISIDGKGESDYTVENLPPALASTSPNQTLIAGVPLQAWIAIGLVSVAAVIVLFIMMRRRSGVLNAAKSTRSVGSKKASQGNKQSRR